jgi:GNAT superfamily N-acetyltransferase
MAARCSPTALFRRFHGVTDGVAYFRALLRDHAKYETHIALYRLRCVGIATIASNAEGAGDLGVLVEDRWQRRGIASRLVASVLPGARKRGLTTLHADVLNDDVFIVEALSRIGRLSVSVDLDAVSLDINLVDAPRRQA